MSTILLAIALMQELSCRGDAARHIASAMQLGSVFDLAGATDAYSAAERAGCPAAGVAAAYLQGLVAARAAEAQFATAESVQPLRQAIAALDVPATSDSVARLARAVLRAAVPAAQHERAEMGLLIEEMLRLEGVQLEAGLPGLPVMTAHEAAGAFWLQVHAYEEANHAFEIAEKRIGATPYVLLGYARVAVGHAELGIACERYRRLMSWWGERSGEPPEIAEARAYLKQPQCAAPSARPDTRP